jgi:predicted Zn-dependent protease with MMP-like domain
MDREEFQRLVEEAVADLPRFFQEKLENIAIVIEDVPAPELAEHGRGELLLGLYRGVPLPQRSVWSFHPYPDIIHIFQRNIERICRTEEEIIEQVRQTVMHEIGHHFGMDEEQLRELGLG